MDVPRLHMTDLSDDSGVDALAAALQAAGCVVIEAAASADTMDHIAAELAEYEHLGSIGASNFEGHHTRRVGSPLPRSKTFRSIALHPAVMAAGDLVLGHATSWRFSAAEYIQIGPGESPQRLHRDAWKYDRVDFGFEVELNAMWAVSDFTEANGATRVVPGSHLAGNDERYSTDDTVPAEMAKGSLMIYTGTLYHGGGPNNSDQWRCGLSLQHAVGWLTQSTNQFLECPPAQVTDWPDELLRFIGYAKTGNGLGYWRDSEDPLKAVHPDRDFERGWATVRPD
ncbi:MAG: phytanoyl-CoA dioxygenase family protein [Acidimicrobiales bacterium]